MSSIYTVYTSAPHACHGLCRRHNETWSYNEPEVCNESALWLIKRKLRGKIYSRIISRPGGGSARGGATCDTEQGNRPPPPRGFTSPRQRAIGMTQHLSAHSRFSKSIEQLSFPHYLYAAQKLWLLMSPLFYTPRTTLIWTKLLNQTILSIVVRFLNTKDISCRFLIF